MIQRKSKTALAHLLERNSGVVCERTTHLLKYVRIASDGELAGMGRNPRVNAFWSSCTRCGKKFLTSVPIGEGHPAA